MNTRIASIFQPLFAGFTAAVLACAPSFAADAGKKTSGAAYEQQKANCLAGRTNQSQADCLKEARNAQGDTARGHPDGKTADLQQNARQRCDALPGDDRTACLARMQGQGTVRGDAASGGVIRELRQVEPAKKP